MPSEREKALVKLAREEKLHRNAMSAIEDSLAARSSFARSSRTVVKYW
jgi:hypothetical protein